MIRFCPNCETERPLDEVFCGGQIGSSPCNWDLSALPIRPVGWRPTTQWGGSANGSHPTTCPQGHFISAGDLICATCGYDIPVNGDAVASNRGAIDGVNVSGWRLGELLPSASKVRQRYIATEETSGRRGVLTLYDAGAEPDPAIYDVLRSMLKDHVPDIYLTGRWEGRAFEVAEELSGGTILDLQLVPNSPTSFEHVVEEIAKALNAFSECGLRHRDLRPHAALIRTLDPLDLVITNFGSARLSEFDLDIVSPLETTPYTAPEALAGGVAAASDWWSMGMILLELLTGGRCFEGIHERAFLIHVLTNGAPLPPDLDPRADLLLRGLLVRDRRQRWTWKEVRRWLDGGAPPIAELVHIRLQDHDSKQSITLAGRAYANPKAFALAAAEESHWEEARTLLLRGAIATWAEEAALDPKVVAGVRQVQNLDRLSDDFRLSLALRALNPVMPLVWRGEIVTPGWLLQHPEEGVALIEGPVPDILARTDSEVWLSGLKKRSEMVRQRAHQLEIPINDGDFRVHALATSRPRLAALWDTRSRLFPDTDHPGLISVLERRQKTEEDLILLLSAEITVFRSSKELLEQAAATAHRAGIPSFDEKSAGQWLGLPRADMYAEIRRRLEAFARCGIPAIDEWADQFRLEGRVPIQRALALLSVPCEAWRRPPKRGYIENLFDFFAKRVTGTMVRGPLTRMIIGKSSARIDLIELGDERRSASSILDHLLLRTDQMVQIDPAVFRTSETLERRIRNLHSHAVLYERDTGINGLYMGFPFLLVADALSSRRPRIAPVLLWPVAVRPEVGTRGSVALCFDRDREEVRLNPALESIFAAQVIHWQQTARELLQRDAIRAADVMDAFGTFASPRGRELVSLPARESKVRAGEGELLCSAVLFHLAYSGQAIAEDLRVLKGAPVVGTSLETILRITEPARREDALTSSEAECFRMSASDPSQEQAVLQARKMPGLLIEGPPGTGKSQTIVNMVADTIGRNETLLIVCQKQAALEVVRKRLHAAGLGRRMMMVCDVHKDREPIVRALRQQIDDLQNASGSGVSILRSRRAQLAGQIDSLEAELNRHHDALYRADPITGLTYRSVMGELIELEAGRGAPLEVPRLRPLLSPLDQAAVARLTEVCGAIAPLWLPSQYEDSPLTDVKQFGADQANVTAFTEDLNAFVQTEKERADVLNRTSDAIIIEDPQAFRRWVANHSETLLRLSSDSRRRLSRWMPLLDSSNRPRGVTLIEALDAVVTRLNGISSFVCAAEDVRAIRRLPDLELTSALLTAETLAVPAPFWRAPQRWWNQRKLQRFFGNRGLHLTVQSFIECARTEAQLRPWRLKFSGILNELHETAPQIIDESVLALRSLAMLYRTQVAEIQSIMGILQRCPNSLAAVAAVKTGTEAAIQDFIIQAKHGCERREAIQRSLSASDALAQWFTDEWIRDSRRVIQEQGCNGVRLERIMAALPTVAAYQQFRTRARHLDPQILDVFTILRTAETALMSIQCADTEKEVRRLIRREALLTWKARFEQEEPSLLFAKNEVAAKIERLAQADRTIREVNAQLLSEGVHRTAVASGVQWEELTRLRGHRKRTLREILDLGTPLGLMKLWPVWLMNPDVASRLLPLKPGLFDVVIYDEASQMPVEHSLPSLYRSKRVIISGDEKQMPPTAFFSSRVEDEEAELFEEEDFDEAASEQERELMEEVWNRREIKDCPDLLQLAKTILPPVTLQIHYRSRYRELIQFSNAAFYAGSLNVPARHPIDEIVKKKPIEFIPVNGTYQNQTNVDEAHRVVEVLGRMWKGVPAPERQSVGVVTFNRKQADLIEEALEEHAQNDLELREAIRAERERMEDGEDMSFFVKNVENVQGDERDVMIFSSTFGRNARGTFRRNFGVLGQTGGERRLNVAVTRARQKIILLTSMPLLEISDFLNTHRRAASPRDFLQSYFEYARATCAGDVPAATALLSRLGAPQAGVSRTGRGINDGFQRAVASFIESCGFRPQHFDEPGAFNFDFVIEDPRTGLFGIGIECDAPLHPLLKSARARELWRPEVLRQSIPVVHRVSSYGWYRQPKQERAVLEDALRKALT